MPGPFPTEISRAWDLEASEQRARTAIPLRRGDERGETAGATLCLGSETSSYTTGSIIEVDGETAWSPA